MEKTPTAPETLVDAIRRFADSDACLTFLADLRWPDGFACPNCQGRKLGRCVVAAAVCGVPRPAFGDGES